MLLYHDHQDPTWRQELLLVFVVVVVVVVVDDVDDPVLP
jgi:hypothetical protein